MPLVIFALFAVLAPLWWMTAKLVRYVWAHPAGRILAGVWVALIVAPCLWTRPDQALTRSHAVVSSEAGSGSAAPGDAQRGDVAEGLHPRRRALRAERVRPCRARHCVDAGARGELEVLSR